MSQKLVMLVSARERRERRRSVEFNLGMELV
jgi:hypothetical protein